MIRFLPCIATLPTRPGFWGCGRLTDLITISLAITICTGRYRFTMRIQGVRLTKIWRRFRPRLAILCRGIPISPFPAIRWRRNLAISRFGAATRMMRPSADGRCTIRLLSAVWIRLWRKSIPMRQHPHPIWESASRLKTGKLYSPFACRCWLCRHRGRV